MTKMLFEVWRNFNEISLDFAEAVKLRKAREKFARIRR